MTRSKPGEFWFADTARRAVRQRDAPVGLFLGERRTVTRGRWRHSPSPTATLCGDALTRSRFEGFAAG